MRRYLLALAIAGIASSSGSAQRFPGYPSRWGPNGNGTLDHEDDLRWVFFNDAKIAADEAKGVYRATFSPTLLKEEGIKLTITGYMLPVERATTSPHFVLTRRTTGCPFCPPNELTEAMEVFATKPIAYTQSPVTIEGTLHLVRESGQGLFYRLNGGVVCKRSEDRNGRTATEIHVT